MVQFSKLSREKYENLFGNCYILSSSHKCHSLAITHQPTCLQLVLDTLIMLQFHCPCEISSMFCHTTFLLNTNMILHAQWITVTFSYLGTLYQKCPKHRELWGSVASFANLQYRQKAQNVNAKRCHVARIWIKCLLKISDIYRFIKDITKRRSFRN